MCYFTSNCFDPIRRSEQSFAKFRYYGRIKNNKFAVQYYVIFWVNWWVNNYIWKSLTCTIPFHFLDTKGAQPLKLMEKNGALSAFILDKHILKEHGLIALNPIVGSLDPIGNTVNPATIGNLSDMGTMGNIMAIKKRPLDVVKFHFNTMDRLIISVLMLVIQVHGVILIRTIGEHGAIVRTKVKTMCKFCSGLLHFCISASLNICFSLGNVHKWCLTIFDDFWPPLPP